MNYNTQRSYTTNLPYGSFKTENQEKVRKTSPACTIITCGVKPITVDPANKNLKMSNAISKFLPC